MRRTQVNLLIIIVVDLSLGLDLVDIFMLSITRSSIGMWEMWLKDEICLRERSDIFIMDQALIKVTT